MVMLGSCAEVLTTYPSHVVSTDPAAEVTYTDAAAQVRSTDGTA